MLGTSPEVGADVEVVIRGTVRRLGASGHAVLVQRVDGVQQWFTVPDLTGAVEFRPVGGAV